MGAALSRDELAAFCEEAYRRFHRREFLSPDPLEVVVEYESIADREIAGIIASSFAVGRVDAIVHTVRSILACLVEIDASPARALLAADEQRLHGIATDFRYRFFGPRQLAGLLVALRRVLADYGSLEAAFRTGVESSDRPAVGGLAALVQAIVSRADGALDDSILLSRPSLGSACKRLVLFLRWMVRSDEIDPGGWTALDPSHLIMPVDTHVLRVASALGITTRKQGNLLTALEITDRFREIVPADPVRYDFCLTRPGIHPLLDEAIWLEGGDPELESAARAARFSLH